MQYPLFEYIPKNKAKEAVFLLDALQNADAPFLFPQLS